jgi:CRP/FNR family cyclic AMP-dependent transcriptional regulator
MKERFEGDQNRKTLTETLMDQRIVAGNSQLAEKVADIKQLLEVKKDEKLIIQDDEDRDVYLILSGSFDIFVNGKLVAKRGPGNHVGEMAAIQPTQRRSATVVANQTSVVLKITEPQLSELGQAHPDMWRAIAKELARRLEERNKLVTNAREKIRVFVISSTEGIEIARSIQNAFAKDPFLVTIWDQGVFKASEYAMESLEKELDDSDFAIAIAHPDDMTESRGKNSPSPRDNVIFELGMFIGRLGLKRTFLVEPKGEEIKLPSDYRGITTLAYRPPANPKDLASVLGPVCNCIREIIKEKGPNN